MRFGAGVNPGFFPTRSRTARPFGFPSAAGFGHAGGRMEPLNGEEIERAVAAALAEDVGDGDVTTLATVPAELTARAVLVARTNSAITISVTPCPDVRTT